MHKTSLSVPEWLAVAIIIAFMAIMSAIALRPQPTYSLKHTPQENLVDATIIGAVSHPGPYSLPKGSTVGDLLQMAEPLPEADLRRIKPSTQLRRNHFVKVPVKK